MKEYFAIDLGASNGRTILGRYDGHKIALEEINRFENNYVRVGNAYYWDVLLLFTHIKEGLGICAKKHTGTLSGIGIDTWGVDFGLIDSHGRLIGNPRAYRDPRGTRGMQSFFQKYDERMLFDLTGIACYEFNTIYQLYDMAQTQDPQLLFADKLLLMPDLLGYMLCGAVSNEYTEASTTQLLDCRTKQWSPKILDMIGVPESLMAPLLMSGDIKGHMLDTVQQETGLKNAPPVFCVGSHDTASAVASIPAKDDNFAFISSGTWSLIGIVVSDALINNDTYTKKFSNEGTVDGAYRLLHNIMGLWVIQNCKRQWDKEEKLSWDDIVEMAKAAPAFRSFIDVNAHEFFDDDDMPQKIQRYCEKTGQPVPQTKGEIARTVYESLAMSYREAFIELEAYKGHRIERLHIVGGGSKNALLNQFTANAINREVIAGPGEATAIGNLMMQVKASGEISGMAQMRQVIRDSFDVESYEPSDTAAWADQYERYTHIKKRQGE